MLDCSHDTLIFVLLTWSPPRMLEAIRTKQINLHLIRPWDMVPVIHVLCRHVDMSSANSLEAFFRIVFRRGFLLGWHPCTPIWCRVRGRVWALTGWPPTSSISVVMLTGLLRRSFKESIWKWRSARALNFFGWPTRGLFWVDPALLKRWKILATVLQLSFRVLAIFL